jgi:hypothetical protein
MADVETTTNIRELHPKPTKPSRNALRQRRWRQRQKRNAAPASHDAPGAAPPVTPRVTPASHRGVTLAALVAAVALAGVSAFFAVTGMVAIFAAAAVPVMLMTATIEGSKLATVAWLARSWSGSPWLSRGPLVAMVGLLMLLTAIGSYGFLSRAHLDHQVTASEAVDHDAAPLAERITLAQSTVHDLDGPIVQLDAMVTASTTRGWTKTGMALVGDQAGQRAALVGERDRAV